MAQYLPPTQDLPIFDSSVFVQASDNLTIEDANRLYIRFPTAQGEVNLLKTNVFDDLTVDGNVQCHTLKYTALDPPVGGATPLLSTILAASPDAGQGRIINLEQLVSQDIEATSITTGTLTYTTLDPPVAGPQTLAQVLQTGANADGEAINNVSVLGATNIEADTITVGTLNYTELNPPVSGTTPTLSQVLTAGSDATGQVIENLDGLFVGSLFLKDFSGGQSNAITFSGAQSVIEIENNINMPNNNIVCDTLAYSHLTPASGYLNNNLLDFMIPNTSTVSTTNLEPAAQTALNLSAINEADIIVLQETTLQISGDPATYTGLPDTNMSLNGDLNMNTYDITNVNEITTSNVNCNNILNIGGYAISGIPTGVNINANIITPLDITCGTLNYTELNPPISGGSQTIEQVLITGSNANGQSLSGLNTLTSQTVSTPNLESSTGYILSPSIVMPVGSLTCKNASSNGVIQTNSIQVFADNATLASVLSPDGTVFAKSYQMFGQSPSKFSVSNAGTTFTTKLEVDETLADSSSSVGTAGQVLSSTGTGIQWITPSSGGGQSLGDVMTVGNTASTDLNMNSNNIANAGSLTIVNPLDPVVAIKQSINNITSTLEFKNEYDEYFANLKCYQLDVGGIFTGSINATSTSQFGNVRLQGYLEDHNNSKGTAGQILSSNGIETIWINPPSSATPTLSAVMTAGNTASVDLNMNNNDITNTASLTLNGTYNIIQSVNAISNALEFTTEFGLAPLKCDSLDADSLFSNTITIANTATTGSIINNGFFKDATLSSGTAGQLLSSTGTATAWVNAPVSATPSLADVMTVGNTASANLNMNNNDIIDVSTIEITKGATTIRQRIDQTTNSLEFHNGSGFADILCNNVNGTDINYRPTYDYFVAKNGSDTNTGSILSPFLTIQKAIDICEAFTDNVPRNINIFYGSYVENLTISKSRIAFNGSNTAGSRADTGCSITGSILINVSSGLSDLNNNNIYFNNLLINGIIADTSSVVHRVGIKDCYLYGNNTVLNFTSSAEYRLFVDYSYLNNESTTSTNPLVNCAGSTLGMVSFTNNQMTSKAKGHVLSVSCRTDTIALNIMTNDNIGADVLAICKLGSTVNNTAYTLGQNAFIYSSTTSKSSGLPYFSTGILMDAPVSKTNFLTVINNTFVMTGLTNSATNFAITGTLNPTSNVYVFYLNNTGVSTFLSPYSFQINSTSGFNKNALQVVQ